MSDALLYGYCRSLSAGVGDHGCCQPSGDRLCTDQNLHPDVAMEAAGDDGSKAG
jgi:hypothetical protein